MISHQHQCIFIHIPKTAGTSIEQKLGHFTSFQRGVQDHRTMRDVQRLVIGDLLRAPIEATQAAPLLQRLRLAKAMARQHRFGRPALSRDQFKSYFKFSFVRNPWARAFSWYQNVLRDPQHQVNLGIPPDCTFRDFLLKHGHQEALRPQLDWLRDHFGAIPLDFIGRFENLASDFAVVCGRLGLKDSALPHMIAGTGADYRSAYDDELKAVVAERYAEEISIFGYHFDQRG